MKKIPNNEWPKCCICGEKKAVCINDQYYCNKHYQSMIRYGTPYGHKRESTNKFESEGGILKIITRKGDVFLADAEDFPKLKPYSWCLSKKGYAVANINGKTTKMHRFVMGVNDSDIIVDHINNDTHDNRKSNLRKCTVAENARNRCVSAKSQTGYLGITITKFGKYRVRITLDRKEIRIGNFDTLDEAIRARNEAEKKYHGEYGNHVEGGQGKHGDSELSGNHD